MRPIRPTHFLASAVARVKASVSAFLITGLLLGCGQAPLQSAGLATPESVVSQVAQRFSDCALDALLTHYSADAEFVSPSTPTPLLGSTALRQHFAGACQGTVRAIMRVDAQRVQMLSADAAVVTGRYSFGRSDRPNDKPWPALFVITLKREAGRWLVQTQATMAVPG